MDENTENTQWYDSLGLDEESVTTIESKGWKDANSIIKSYRELEKFSGKDKNDYIEIPKAENGEADFSSVYQKLGRPESAEGYDLPESGFAEAAKEVLFKNGISQSQAKALMEFVNEYAEKTNQEYETKHAEEVEARNEELISSLKKSWGASFDKNIEMCKLVTKDLQITDEQLDAIGDIMGPDKVANMFLRMATKTDADQPLTGYESSAKPSAEQARSRIAEIQSNPEMMKKLAAGDVEIGNELMRLAALTVE